MSSQGAAKGRAVRGLDHVVVMVDGIDAAQAAYERLGFQVQPRGFHRKLGTANHLMIFDTDYFEILGIVEDTEFNAERREWLKGGGGLANVALATDGADISFEAFRKAGLNPDAPLFFDRAVEVAGKTEHAQFRTVRIPKTNMPVVGFFVCEHITPQFVYRPEWANHPNGARGIAGVTTVSRFGQFRYRIAATRDVRADAPLLQRPGAEVLGQHAEVVLELLELRGQRGLAHEAACCRLAEVSRVRDRHQVAQVLELQVGHETIHL